MRTVRTTVWVCLLGVLMLADARFAVPVRGQTAAKPVAHAGPNQIVIGINVAVQLDGSASTDPAGHALTYRWTIIDAPAGSTATLNGADTARPTFVPDRK